MEYRVKIGRPKLRIDWERVSQLLAEERSIKEVASIMEINYPTLWKRLKEERRNNK